VTLTVHRAERSDVLVRRLGELLAEVPSDPFAPTLVAVPSRGVERWIAQSLSSRLGDQHGRGDGVCANVHFPSPGRIVRDALAAASGIDPDNDPWDQTRLVWPLLEVIDGCAGEEWCRTLGRHLGLVEGAVNQGRRMAVAQKLAGLYSAYASERPTMLLEWSRGHDGDGYGAPLEDDLRWQAELWRRLSDHLGVPSLAERLEPACAALRGEPGLVDLPERLSIFGPTRLSTVQLTVLDALAARRDLHLWLPHPSDGLWRRISSTQEYDEPPARREDPTAELPQHPLVRALARDAREMQVRLRAHLDVATDDHLEAPATPRTLLGALQHDLHADREPGGHQQAAGQEEAGGRHELSPDDRSIQVHACHGRHRQVEVLREVLLGMLADDPTLELRDVIVMCPDIEAYAPLLSASFGIEVDEDADHDDQVHPGHQLTFRLADRSLRQTNPVLGVAARLLELADARLTASEVLDLIAMPPVRRRFRLDDDALERAGDWVRRAGVRWGLDADARARYGLGGIAQNTWQHGLDRILTGVVMDEEDLRIVGDALPLDDVDSTEIELAGRLAELVDRLDAALAALSREQGVEEWLAALDDAVDSLVDVAPRDAWQVTQAKATLAGAVASAANPVVAPAGNPAVASAGKPNGTAAMATALRLSDVRALLGDRLKGRPTRANFRTGHLTICTMVPMRSVPHRVVCLLGLDDGVFPRGASIDGDDILARRPRVGERDRRSEDRQLFLDAILAAEERLVVLYTGADERTGAERPPAVPLGELLDVLERTAVVGDGRVRDRIVVRHPLQPFDARNFEDGRLGAAGAFSFDVASHAGSLALRDGQHECPPFLSEPLPELGLETRSASAAPSSTTAGVVELEKLIRFLEHPVRGFLQQRLDLRTADEEDEPSDAVPVDPNALEKWGVGDRLLRAGLRGRSDHDAVAVELRRGELPPGRLGELLIDPIVGDVDELLQQAARLVSDDSETVDVSVELPSKLILAGSIPRVQSQGVTRVEYSRLSPKHRIRAWVQLLALTAHRPDQPWKSAVVGRGDGKKGSPPVVWSLLGPVGEDEALRLLDDLVALHRIGLTRPLPAPPKTSCVYATSRTLKGMSPDNALVRAGQSWMSKSSTGEMWGEHDGDHRRVGLVTLGDLTAARPDDVPLDNPHGEPHLFGLLATRIWAPLLATEVLRP
jgi:exodeoxyribonuclease V gamma subunit